MHTPLESTYFAPTSPQIADYRIRKPSNFLFEDADIEEDIFYRITPGALVTRLQIATCAHHFSSYYGVWRGETAGAACGRRVRMGSARLRAQCLPEGGKNVLVTAMTGSGEQVGHCFVSQWMGGEKERVWWITQLVVVDGYRNQRRATRMLHALTLHYDVGKKAELKDLVGVLSSHPYAICAVLRVFGRGIEALPSKLDWERDGKEYTHVPLPSAECFSLMTAAPFEYVREAKIQPESMTADTKFFIDHTAAEDALERIVHSMNRQIREPWEWLFGELAPGCEYLCVLEFCHDPQYKMHQQWCDGLQVWNEVQPAANTEGPSLTTGSNPSPAPIRYADYDRYLLEVPSSCRLDLRLADRTHASLIGSKRKRILEAKDVIAKQMIMLPIIMGAKRIPEDLQNTYQTDALDFPLPVHMSTWRDFTKYAYETYRDDPNVAARLLILQAIHFQELLDERDRLRTETQKRTAEMGKREGKEKATASQEPRSPNSPESTPRQQIPLQPFKQFTIPHRPEPATTPLPLPMSLPAPTATIRLNPNPLFSSPPALPTPQTTSTHKPKPKTSSPQLFFSSSSESEGESSSKDMRTPRKLRNCARILDRRGGAGGG
ncbi:hypothetical protein BDW02DRAFT_601122 [Decorospora gaudefroyi]|uniref:N-acetyltransferase domain-containing protein n=1 Tax=Decorospora gaudefroyi TaxID=184978 RepID=A0A6A5K245_9PLEO|nr:hypothetical protein BDW02DRAFT_601122 [Decorospora gaudefroyi]